MYNCSLFYTLSMISFQRSSWLHIRISMVALCIWAACSPLPGQQTLNLDFNRASIEGIARPWGWDLASWYGNPFQLDSTFLREGRYSLRIQTDEGQRGPHLLQSNLEPYLLKDQKIRIYADLHTADWEGSIRLILAYATMDRQRQFADTSMVLMESTQPHSWSELQGTFTIPPTATSLYVGVEASGTGKAWVDYIRLSHRGQPLTTLPAAAPFPPAHEKRIARSVRPFSQSPDASAQHLDFLPEYLGDCRILALGESTHGTREFFQLKHQVLAYAVEQLGYRIFAIEDNQLACQPVNSYVLGQDTLSAREAMKGLFAVWYTEEVVAMVEWMRSYNREHPDDPVFFVGFDMQDWKRPYLEFLEFLEVTDAPSAAFAKKRLEGFEAYAKNPFIADDSTKQEWANAIDLLVNTLRYQGDVWLYQASVEDSLRILEGFQAGRLLYQWAENTYQGHWSLYRDEAMARNVKWLLETRYRNKKMVIWAHDVHIAQCRHPNDVYNLNQGKAMGRFLEERYIDDYISLALMTHTGFYLALRSYSDFTRVHSPLYASPVGSWGEALHRISEREEQQDLFLSLAGNRYWMSQPRPFRSANHVHIDYGFFQQISLPGQFDGVFFLDKTSPARYLGKKN